ncbi:hypothetical protein CP358_01135 [Lactobacillus sp. UMNPBX7]|nr:hypothetical protein CP364_01340 [Lactobacillus sp. UMNPBX13]PEH01407.1 hypothetical protein CP358_01135 [Lactobacillus sp. UMNPBX7]
MRELLNSNDTSTIKQGDTSETIRLSARSDNQPVTWTEDNTAEVHVETDAGAFVKKFPVKLVTDSNNVLVNSEDLAELKPGKYALELWVKLSNGKNAIWPSDQALPLAISKNADDIEAAGEITTIAFDDFKKEVTKEIQIQAEKAGLTDQNGRKVDLTDYAKKSDVPNIVYDVDSRTLTVNGVKVDLPSDVDLSGYAKKSELPKIVYDADKRTLTVNGTKVDLPSNVDLSDYVKTEDLKDYAEKSDIPEVPTVSLDVEKRTVTVNGQTITIPNSVDLSGYAKSADVPSVKLDGRTLTVNGTVITIPDTVDLTGYYTKSEVDQKLASAQTGGKVDLSRYLTVENADETYAKKTDIPAEPDLTDYVKKEDLPKEPDLSSYETKADAENTYAKKTDIPAKPDLTDYVKKEDLPAAPDLSSYETKADADKIYAKKTDIPASPDLTDYVKRETLSDYAKKSDITNLKPGKDGHSIWYTSEGINWTAENPTVTMQSVINASDSQKPEVDDLIIDSNGDVHKITAVTNDTVTADPNRLMSVKGAAGSTPSIDPVSHHWIIDGTDTGVTAQGENGKDGQDATNNLFVKNGMVEVGGANYGLVSEYASSQLHQSDFNYQQDMAVRIIPQSNFKTWTGITNGHWTLDVDDNTLTNDSDPKKKIKLMTGLYLLRDLDSDVTVKSTKNLGLNSSTTLISQITQLIVTPYMVVANAVVNEYDQATSKSTTKVDAFWRSNWDSDLMPYWGVSDDWNKM